MIDVRDIGAGTRPLNFSHRLSDLERMLDDYCRCERS